MCPSSGIICSLTLSGEASESVKLLFPELPTTELRRQFQRLISSTPQTNAPWPSRNGGKKASLSGWIGTGALKVAVYIKLCPQKNKVTKTKTALKQETY